MIESPAHIPPLVAELFDAKVVLITECLPLSFAELEVRSNQLADAMVSVGSIPDNHMRELAKVYVVKKGGASPVQKVSSTIAASISLRTRFPDPCSTRMIFQ